MYFFVLYKHAPVWDMLEETKIKVHENPDHDLALDYYYTPEDGLTIPDAMQRYESFYRDDFDPWALRVNSVNMCFCILPTLERTTCLKSTLRMTQTVRKHLPLLPDKVLTVDIDSTQPSSF